MNSSGVFAAAPMGTGTGGQGVGGQIGRGPGPNTSNGTVGAAGMSGTNGAGASNAGGFFSGQTYFGDTTGIGRITRNAATVTTNWCVLTNGTVENQMLLRGSLCWDRTGVWSNHLVGVTSGNLNGGTDPALKGVWRVDAQGQPTLITQIETSHLEGVITLPNDTNKFGPWAGKIITGDEEASPVALIYMISPNGVVTTNDSTQLFPDGIYTEDFEIIPTNQDLFACDPDAGLVVKLPASYFTNHIGDLLINQAGEANVPAALFILHWNSGLAGFETLRITYRRPNGSIGHFEHVAFAPINIPPLH